MATTNLIVLHFTSRTISCHVFPSFETMAKFLARYSLNGIAVGGLYTEPAHYNSFIIMRGNAELTGIIQNLVEYLNTREHKASVFADRIGSSGWHYVPLKG